MKQFQNLDNENDLENIIYYQYLNDKHFKIFLLVKCIIETISLVCFCGM